MQKVTNDAEKIATRDLKINKVNKITQRCAKKKQWHQHKCAVRCYLQCTANQQV